MDSRTTDCCYNYRYSGKVFFSITFLSNVTNESYRFPKVLTSIDLISTTIENVTAAIR